MILIARHTYIISLRIWSHFTHKPGNPRLIKNKLFQYLAKFWVLCFNGVVFCCPMHCDLLRSIVLPHITSQLVLFLWQTVEIGPLGHVRVVEALQNSNSVAAEICRGQCERYSSGTTTITLFTFWNFRQNSVDKTE